jgi:hypothetical protein
LRNGHQLAGEFVWFNSYCTPHIYVKSSQQYASREALAVRADVTRWDDQVALFKRAVDTYGQVDVVVANAGVGEIGQFDPFGEIMQKEPSKPTMVTPNVNVTGVLYSEYFTFESIQYVGDRSKLCRGNSNSIETCDVSL